MSEMTLVGKTGTWLADMKSSVDVLVMSWEERKDWAVLTVARKPTSHKNRSHSCLWEKQKCQKKMYLRRFLIPVL